MEPVTDTPLAAAEIAQLPLAELLRRCLLDSTMGFSMGTFGALAEFLRTSDEPLLEAPREAGAPLVMVTSRGGIRLDLPTDLSVCAYERPQGHAGDWTHGIALCLPTGRAGRSRRRLVTELGEDRAALRPAARGETAFDLGLGCMQTDACVRSGDPAVLEQLRAARGRSLFDAALPLLRELPRLSPARVFCTALGRIEVYQAIPPADGKTPDGPHTHVLPDLLRHDRTHDANTPIPDGLTPCAFLHPPHPCRDASDRPGDFDHAAHARFQALLQRFGQPELLAVKAAVVEAVRSGAAPDTTRFATRRARAMVRVTLRQLARNGVPTAALARWRAVFEPGSIVVGP